MAIAAAKSAIRRMKAEQKRSKKLSSSGRFCNNPVLFSAKQHRSDVKCPSEL
jgi:hypothetical protein